MKKEEIRAVIEHYEDNNYFIQSSFYEEDVGKVLIKGFSNFIHTDYFNISEEMLCAIKTYRRYEEYIINSLIYPYSNGVVEGINTKIKLLKRIAYGYRNFKNFRLKILLSFNLIEDIDDIERKEKRKKYKNTS